MVRKPRKTQCFVAFFVLNSHLLNKEILDQNPTQSYILHLDANPCPIEHDNFTLEVKLILIRNESNHNFYFVIEFELE